MKLIQLNMWGGRLESQLINFFESEQPDIVCLQEAISIEGNSPFFTSVEDIQEAIGAEYVYMSPTISFNYMHRTAYYGNCIISRYPIKETETIFTGGEYIENFDKLGHGSNIRNLQRATIALPDGSELQVLNHHGHHIPHHKNGDEETMRQCGIIANQIKKLNGRVVLAGDFNLNPSSSSLKQINNLLINLSVKAKLESTRNFLTHKTEVCDYIFVSDGINVETFSDIKDIVSDHEALVLKFN